MRRQYLSRISVVLVLVALCCSPNEPEPARQSVVNAKTDLQHWFEDVAGVKGLDFVHQDARSGRRYYVETAASGGGFLDYDGDGDLDIYLLNGAPTPGFEQSEPLNNRLYENRDGQFVDVSDASGLADEGYGMGMCVGDIDADGLLDVFISNYGSDRLFRNLGNGRFEDVTEKAGVGGTRWGTGCAFADVDMDGDLDLYVANYVNFSFEQNPRCGDPTRNLWSYCRPDVFDGQPDYLYINNGHGVFENQAWQRGIANGLEDKGFGVVITDLNQDGAPDILVANDGTKNRYYVNDGKGHFEDQSLFAGLGYNRNGQPEAGMGLAVADINGSGHQEILVTNYAFETNTVYGRLADDSYEDVTFTSGLGEASRMYVGWGAQLLDANNDTHLDLWVANGHVLDNVAAFEPSLQYAQPNQFFLGNGTGVFSDFSNQAGLLVVNPSVSRALAIGDMNNDGALDVLITNTNGAPQLHQNHIKAGAWLGLILQGPTANPFAIGTRVSLYQRDTYLGMREVRSGGSFLSQDDLRLHFGLADRKGPFQIRIRWPNGALQQVKIEEVNRYIPIAYQPEIP